MRLVDGICLSYRHQLALWTLFAQQRSSPPPPPSSSPAAAAILAASTKGGVGGASRGGDGGAPRGGGGPPVGTWLACENGVTTTSVFSPLYAACIRPTRAVRQQVFTSLLSLFQESKASDVCCFYTPTQWVWDFFRTG